MTSQEMMRTTAPSGQAWMNIAAVDEQPNWVLAPNPHGDHSDPNYGFKTLFGYEESAFMARQYRR